MRLSDLERSKSRSFSFQSFIANCKGAELGLTLLLSSNRKLYMGSPMAPPDLSELEGLNSRSLTV